MVCMVNHTAIKIQALNAAGAGGATYYNSSVNASSTGNFSVAAPEDVELCPAADSGGGPSIVSHFCRDIEVPSRVDGKMRYLASLVLRLC